MFRAGSLFSSSRRRLHLFQVLALGLAATGCGDSVDPRANNAVHGPPALLQLDASELPIGDYLPPLDEGRVELADPSNWQRFPRSKKYLARFYRGMSSSLPWLIVTADDSPYEGITEVGEDNYQQLLEAVAADVSQRPSLIESPLPMKIGDNYCVRFVLKASLNKHAAEQQILVTVLGGRRYTIDLQIAKGTMEDYKRAGYAVAASLRPASTSLPQPDLPPEPEETAAPDSD